MTRCVSLFGLCAFAVLCSCSSGEPAWTHDGTIQAACFYPLNNECVEYLKPLLDTNAAEFKEACVSDNGKWKEASCPSGYFGSCRMTTWVMHIYDEERIDKSQKVCEMMPGVWSTP
ncbi:MAG: hypothetical protein QM765_45000 [Myxococcales bacterium]